MIDETFPPYPWLQEIWNQLQKARAAQRLPHALLFTGSAGLGKRALADLLVASLLCETPDADGRPCGTCRGCQLMQAGTHPDFHRIEPEEPGKAIRIDAIREYIGKEGLTSHAGGYKVVLIEPAEAMNQAAANSLLKTLEEPSGTALILLLSSRPTSLPATIRSRCQRITFPVPPQESAVGWLRGRVGEQDPVALLQLAHGAPLLALRLAEGDVLQLRQRILKEFTALVAGKQDPVTLAGRWEKQDPAQLLQWISGWVIDILRLKADGNPPAMIDRQAQRELQAAAVQLDARRLFAVLDRAYRAIQALDGTLNIRLLLEELLLELIAARAVA